MNTFTSVDDGIGFGVVFGVGTGVTIGLLLCMRGVVLVGTGGTVGVTAGGVGVGIGAGDVALGVLGTTATLLTSPIEVQNPSYETAREYASAGNAE